MKKTIRNIKSKFFKNHGFKSKKEGVSFLDSNDIAIPRGGISEKDLLRKINIASAGVDIKLVNDPERSQRYQNLTFENYVVDENILSPEKFFEIGNALIKHRLKRIDYAQIKLKFKNSSGGVVFRQYNLDDFVDFITTFDDRSVASGGSDAVPEDMELDQNFLQLVIIWEMAGGAIVTPVKSRIYDIDLTPSDNNNCLFTALKQSSLSVNLTPNQIRGKIGLEENTKIPISKIKDVEKIYKASIHVFGETSEGRPVRLYKGRGLEAGMSILEVANVCYIYYQNGHFSRILRETKDAKKKRRKKKRGAREKIQKETPTKLLFFDIETIFDASCDNLLKPYSISWSVWGDKGKSFKYNKKMLKSDCVYLEVGFDCIEKFIKWLISSGEKYKLIGFNSSRFDNFFVADEAIKQDVFGGMMYVNNSILNMYIGGSSCWDLCRFLTCSLKKACNDFKITPKKLDGFSHELPQKAFEEGKLDAWIEENYDQLSEYNKLDVLSLMALTLEFYSCVNGMIKEDVFKYSTIGQLSFRYWSKNKKIKKLDNREDDEFIRSSLTAGRTQAYYDKLNIEGKFKMVDVCSLYPFVMKNFEYPSSEKIKHVSGYKAGKMGVYKCVIKHQNMEWKNKSDINFGEFYREYAPVVYPLRTKETPLNWTHRGEITCTLCSVDIECIRENGGEVQVNEGYYFEESSKDVFSEYITTFESEKNNQDKLKKNDDPGYNPSLRQFCKLALNSLSGKVIQKNYDDVYQHIKSDFDLHNFCEIVKKPKLVMYSDNLMFGSGKLLSGKYSRNAKPAYLGVFIYAHARRYMYNTILRNYVVLYEDTDSALIPQNEYERMLVDNPEIFNGKKFGNLDEEVGNATHIITISPKCYLVENKDDQSLSKRKFKGVSKWNTWTEISEIKKIGKKDHYYIRLDGELHDVRCLSNNHIRDLIKSEKKALTNEMFDMLYEGRKIAIFSSPLAKYRDDLCIKQRFMCKVI